MIRAGDSCVRERLMSKLQHVRWTMLLGWGLISCGSKLESSVNNGSGGSQAGCAGGGTCQSATGGYRNVCLDSATTSVPSCKIPESISDAGSSCKVSRAFVRCSASIYTTVVGLADSVPLCSSDCLSICALDEYAASCGNIGPSTSPGSVAQLPDSCRAVEYLPGGATFYCCSCE